MKNGLAVPVDLDTRFSLAGSGQMFFLALWASVRNVSWGKVGFEGYIYELDKIGEESFWVARD